MCLCSNTNNILCSLGVIKITVWFVSMAEGRREVELPEDVDSDDCLTSYKHIYSPDLLKYDLTTRHLLNAWIHSTSVCVIMFMKSDSCFRDQVAFITGGGSGIGLRMADVFMRWAGLCVVTTCKTLSNIKSFSHISFCLHCQMLHQRMHCLSQY